MKSLLKLKQIDPQTKQKQIYSEVKSLGFEIFYWDSKSLFKGAIKPNNIILNNAYLTPKYHRNGATKTEFLQDTVLGCTWSEDVLIQNSKNFLPYQQLLAKLHGAITTNTTAKKENRFIGYFQGNVY